MTKKTKVLTGVLAGAALGITIALLLTSDKKGNLQRKAEDWFCDVLKKSKKKMAGMSEKVDKVIDHTKNQAENLTV
ncbi:YtxH domain-containing protein [Pedobacter montanisoli]|uniref:YtxH domain-containing protein n=1 Tax=Pedobacter montanisoli TaxID=2923277 RepID=A0ABS9ZTY4_9SPHI|nr:YtxH domain-containing protein [Pedobacter montanisoli]MCJ0742065.1 YtxH domain-containing protein [Pedobacter montanisoli]